MFMHLRINLSNDVIKAWKPMVSEILPESEPLMCWRLDRIRVGRSSANFVCVNEATLFSFLITDMAGKKPVQIQQAFVAHFRALLQEYAFPEPALTRFKNLPVFFGKTNSRRVIGCVTDLKKNYQLQHEITDTLETAERQVNRIPYSLLNYGSPDCELMMLRQQFLKDSDKGILLKLPPALVFAARRAFDRWPRALYCFDMRKPEADWVEGYLVLQELSELGARLMGGPDSTWSMPDDPVHLKDLLDIVVSEVDRLT